MSILERGRDFVSEAGSLNRKSFDNYVQIQKGLWSDYLDANQTRFAALHDAKGLRDLVTVQGEYYSALRSSATASVRQQVELARGSVTDSYELLKRTLSTDGSVEEAPAAEEKAEPVLEEVSNTAKEAAKA